MEVMTASEEVRRGVARVIRKAYMAGPEGVQFKPEKRNVDFDDLPPERQEKWLRMADAAIEKCFKDIG